MRTVALCWLVAVCGCSKPCDELGKQLQMPGWRPGSESACRRELEGLDRIKRSYGTALAWQTTAHAGMAGLFFAIPQGLVALPPEVPLPRFDKWPSRPPCPTGLETSAAMWEQSPFAKLAVPRPPTLFASYGIEVTDAAHQKVTIRMWQDFNCNGVEGLSYAEGAVDRVHNRFMETAFHSSEFITE